jgi:hypothetical protein
MPDQFFDLHPVRRLDIDRVMPDSGEHGGMIFRQFDAGPVIGGIHSHRDQPDHTRANRLLDRQLRVFE